MFEREFKVYFLMLLECFFWFSLPAFFVFFYVKEYGASLGFVWGHISILFGFWAVCFSLRLLVWRFFSFAGLGVQKIISVVLLFFPLFFLLAWYVAVLVGLFSWGRIATWSLVKVYLMQFFQVSSVLGFSEWVLVAVALVVPATFFLLYRVLSGGDWCARVASYFSAPALVVFSMLGVMIFGVQFFRLYNAIDIHPQEPISVSLFGNGSSLQQSHNLAVSPVVDMAENMALFSYKAVLDFNPRNVVLIVGDALRADHMGIYGYPRPTTPLLEASARKHQTLVIPSVRSICSESSCGLRAIASSRPLHLFPTRALTLHEVLRRQGYSVSLFLSGDHTNFYGLKESYGDVDSYFDGMSQSQRYVNDDMLLVDRIKKLPNFDGARPLFFQFHLMSSHGLGLRHEIAEIFQPHTNYYRWVAMAKGRVAPSLDDIPMAVNYYDNGVFQFDRVTDEILDVLASKGYLDDAVVVFTGDHGEMLGEKGIFGHQRRVNEEVLHIPLIIQRRGYSGGGIGQWPLSSQIDIAPSILAELGISSPSVWKGFSLQSPSVSRFVYFQQAPQAGIYIVGGARGVLKYWKDFSTGEEFLYDVASDPAESRNIIGSVSSADVQLWRNEVMKSMVSK